MSLSCECSDDYDYYVDAPNDYSELATSRRKRCMSCDSLIDIGSIVLQFGSWRRPLNDIEEAICGDEVQLANKYLCEECGDIYTNLSALGFCVDFGESMKVTMQEYIDIYQPLKISTMPSDQPNKQSEG